MSVTRCLYSSGIVICIVDTSTAYRKIKPIQLCILSLVFVGNYFLSNKFYCWDSFKLPNMNLYQKRNLTILFKNVVYCPACVNATYAKRRHICELLNRCQANNIQLRSRQYKNKLQITFQPNFLNDFKIKNNNLKKITM